MIVDISIISVNLYIGACTPSGKQSDLTQTGCLETNKCSLGWHCILTLFEFAFGYLESKELKECGKQLEELECHFKTNNELPGKEDTVSKKQDETDAADQFADAKNELKLKKC